jgi:hypothetical protein
MNASSPGIKIVTQQIEDAIKQAMAQETRERFWVTHYGANEINPKHLVYWICVHSDKEKVRLEHDAVLLARLRELLILHHYPESGCAGVFIGFESQQTVDRQSGGNWWHHWK